MLLTVSSASEGEDNMKTNPCRTPGVFFWLIAAMVITLTGCSKQAIKQELVFYPPAPDPPRIQYLMGIASSADVVEEKSSFTFFISGQDQTEAIRPVVKPYGVAVYKGKIYVADSGASRVVIMDLAKKTFDYLPGATGPGSLKKPINLAFDPEGNLYVTDTARKEVLQFDPEGKFVRVIGKNDIKKPADVVADKDTIFVLDITANDIKVFDKRSGELLRTIGKASEGTPGLSIPTNMAFDGKNNIYVANTGEGNIRKMDKDGHILATFGKMGDAFGEFGRPRGIAVDDAGRFYVVDASHQNVQVFNDQGRLLIYFGDAGKGPGSMNLPAGVVTTKENLEYFQKLAAPDFILENVIIVTNQFAKKKVAIYGLGEMKGGAPAPNREENKPKTDAVKADEGTKDPGAGKK